MLDYGQAYRPFGKSPKWTNRLPDSAAIDLNSAATVAQLAAQSTLVRTTLNVNSWTIEPIVVSATQPLVSVGWHGGAWEYELQAVLKLGVPIPPGTKPTNDGDASLSIWQPDKDVLYELYGVVVDASGAYSASFGTRLRGINTTLGCRQYSAQSYKDYATNPDSLFARPTWGVQGSGIPYAPGVLTKADCDRGYVDHMLLLEVVNARAGGFVWPALKDDGNDHSTTQLVREGQVYRLPPGYVIPATWPYLLRLTTQAARDHGLIVTDRSSCLAMRAAPSCAPYLAGLAPWQVLDLMPWRDLQLLVVGTDVNPTPISP